MDEMSPARGELIDRVGSPFESSWRPQEAWALQNFDQLVRNMNDEPHEPVPPGQRQPRADEVRAEHRRHGRQRAAERDALATSRSSRGARSIRSRASRSRPRTPVAQADEQSEVDALNAAVAARQYTGVQDYDDWRGEPADRYDDYWDPDEAPPSASSSVRRSGPRYHGLLERAQQAFTAEGLNDPVVHDPRQPRHDLAGDVPGGADDQLPDDGVHQGVPERQVRPGALQGEPRADRPGPGRSGLRQRAARRGAARAARSGPALPAGRASTRALHGNADNGHGFKFVSRAQNRTSNGAAEYYAFTRSGVRFIAIDTNAEGGSASGNVDDPQYRWIESELRKARRKGLLAIAFSHHPLRSQTATVTDEEATACDEAGEVQCDHDPRNSTPIHRGLAGKKSMRNLFLKYPNFIAYVVGHIHENEITAHKRRGGDTGFWEIATASRARLAAAGPADRVDGQRRRHAVDLRDDGRHGGPGRDTTARRRRGDTQAVHGRRAGRAQPPDRGERPAGRVQRQACRRTPRASGRTATSSW